MNEKILRNLSRAESAAQLLELARDEGVDLSVEKANELFEKYHPPIGELTDRELEDVTGGGCSSRPAPKFQVGDHVAVGAEFCGLVYRTRCPSPYWVVTKVSENGSMSYFCDLRCPNCGNETQQGEFSLYLYE